MKTGSDSSFLAPPGEILDWRRVILTASAMRNGLLDALPGTERDVASQCGLDAHSTRVILDALSVWQVVERYGSTYSKGSRFPSAEDQLVLQQHAQFMHRWGSGLDDRMTDRFLDHHPPRPPGALEAWLSALGVNAQKGAPDIIGRCLAYFDPTSSVLDVAGGHGEYGIEASRRGCEVTLLDIPEVIDAVSAWPSITQSGIHTLGVDVYEAETDKHFDLVLVFGFTHTQPADKLGRLFQRLFEMTAPGGGVAVHTFLRDSGPVPALFAVQMLLTGRGGDTHRLEEYSEWMTDAGFETPQVDDLGGRALLLAHKPERRLL